MFKVISCLLAVSLVCFAQCAAAGDLLREYKEDLRRQGIDVENQAALMQLLGSNASSDFQLRAAFILAANGNKDAAPLIRRALTQAQDLSPSARGVMASSLLRIDGSSASRETVHNLLDKEDNLTRKLSLGFSLAWAGDEGVYPLLLESLTSASPTDRTAALSGVGALAVTIPPGRLSPEPIDILLATLASSPDKWMRLEAAAELRLVVCEGEHVRARGSELAAALRLASEDDRDDGVRRKALAEVAHIEKVCQPQ